MATQPGVTIQENGTLHIQGGMVRDQVAISRLIDRHSRVIIDYPDGDHWVYTPRHVSVSIPDIPDVHPVEVVSGFLGNGERRRNRNHTDGMTQLILPRSWWDRARLFPHQVIHDAEDLCNRRNYTLTPPERDTQEVIDRTVALLVARKRGSFALPSDLIRKVAEFAGNDPKGYPEELIFKRCRIKLFLRRRGGLLSHLHV